MIPMKHQRFFIGFIPEASAAFEFGDSWESNDLHKTTTISISQWLGPIISYEYRINELKKD